MNKVSTLRKSMKIAAIAAPLIAGFAALAAAHSTGSCVDNVVDSCNAAHPNNYNARIACTNNGITACNSHSHGGGSGVKPGATDFTTESGPKQSRIRRIRKPR